VPKFFIRSNNFTGDQAIITGTDVHHIIHVLRKKVGDKLIITLEDKKNFYAQIKSITPLKIDLHILEQIPSSFQNKHTLILAQGIPKHTKMDLIIQKATELGVEEIIPLTSSHSFINSKGMISQTRWTRWQKIAYEAAKQCGRNTLPMIHDPTGFLTLLQNLKEETSFLGLLLWEKEHQNRLKDVLSKHQKIKKIIVLIGPEGSFSADEIQSAKEAQFIPVCCAPWILRCETAAIYALSTIQYEFNF